MTQIVYRIVEHNPPENSDYLTYEEKGMIVEVDDPNVMHMSQGLSVIGSLASARKRARGLPWRGTGFIAAYNLPDDETFKLEQTGKSSSHYTLWCDRERLRECLIVVVPILEDPGNV